MTSQARQLMGDSTVTAAAKQPEVPSSNAPLVCERSSASPPKRAARSRTPARGTEPQAPEAPPPSTIALVCDRVERKVAQRGPLHRPAGSLEAFFL